MNENESSQHIVIIGNGIAGVSAAEAARQTNRQINITVISEENYSTYYRPRLSEEITNDDDFNKDLFLHPEEWYKERNISLILGKQVIKILPAQKAVLLSTGEELKYSKLIIASGCSGRIPEIKGNDKDGVYCLRTLDDAVKIKQRLKTAKETIVAGGGLLGLEAAYSLHKKGHRVSVIERSERLLIKQLDYKGSAVLENKIRSLGINLCSNVLIESIDGGKQAEEILLSNGLKIKTDFILFSAGVIPKLELLKNSGITLNKGIVVNEKMMTNDNSIYACGDVAEFQGSMPGQWLVALNQGKTAGINSAGGDAEYSHTVVPYFLNTMGTKIYSIGDIGTGQTAYDTLEFEDTDSCVYQKLFFSEGLCVGAILMGDVSKFTKINNAVKNNLSKEAVINQNLIVT